MVTAIAANATGAYPMMKSFVSAMLLSLAIGAGTCLAQGAAPAPTWPRWLGIRHEFERRKRSPNPAPTGQMPKVCTARRARNSGRIANELVAKHGERYRQVQADVLVR